MGSPFLHLRRKLPNCSAANGQLPPLGGVSGKTAKKNKTTVGNEKGGKRFCHFPPCFVNLKLSYFTLNFAIYLTFATTALNASG